jgi:DNA-binding NarL/FixJ family response regulator
MKKNAQTAARTGKKRILILDDHPTTRLGLKALLDREPDFVVCCEAGDVSQAHAAVNTCRPDLVVTDLTMPGKGGLEFIRELRKAHPRLPVLVVSMHDEEIYAERALQGGARGFVMKSDDGRNLVAAARQVLRGEIYVSKKMAALLLHQIAGRRPNRRPSGLRTLTGREFDVFQLLGQGLRTGQIAQRLHISGKTVETHRGHIKRKLNLPGHAELTAYAIRWAAAQP